MKLVQISEVLGVTVNDFIYTTSASVTQSLGELARLSTCPASEKQQILAQKFSEIIQTYITQ